MITPEIVEIAAIMTLLPFVAELAESSALVLDEGLLLVLVN